MARERVGFIGTGAMGGGMVESLLKSQFRVTAFDVDPATVQRLGERGATIADSARGVAEAAQIVFACLPSQAASRKVAEEIVGARAIEVYVEASTIGCGTIDAIGSILKSTRVALLDAPVSGGSKGAYDGMLSTIVAGSRAAFDRARPAIDAYAKHVFYLGDVPGHAQIAKLINNLLSLAGRAIAFEGTALGLRMGIDPKVLGEFINVSTGRNMATMDEFPSRLLHIFHSGSKKSIGVKDLELYVEEAQRLGAPLITAPVVLDLYLEGAKYDGTRELPYAGYIEELRSVLSDVQRAGSGA